MRKDIQPIEIHGNIILDAITKKLYQEFPDIPVYTETINQGDPHPYFMVYLENFSQQKQLDRHYLQTYVISVLYQYKDLPETSYTEGNIMGVKLSDILETIQLDNGELVRGYYFNFYPEYQKVVWFGNYDIRVYREKTQYVKQRNLEILTKVKQSKAEN